EELTSRYPDDPTAHRGVYEVLKTGRSIHLASIPEQAVLASARDTDHARLLKALGLKSYMIVPLLARERVLGAITLVATESGFAYGLADVAFIEDLARRAAVAIDNARLYLEAQQLNARLEQRVEERTIEL